MKKIFEMISNSNWKGKVLMIIATFYIIGVPIIVCVGIVALIFKINCLYILMEIWMMIGIYVFIDYIFKKWLSLNDYIFKKKLK